MSTIACDLQSLTPSAKLEFFVVDVTALGGGVLHFHNGTNELQQPVVWQGVTYQYIAIQAEGFEYAGDGPAPRPTLTIGDMMGLMSAEVRLYDDLRGARLIRKQTQARFLDAVNFAAGNVQADPTAQYDDELWKFDRIASRVPGVAITWELTNPMDLESVMLPASQIRTTICDWVYRSGEGCDYAGPPVAMFDDTPTSDPAKDRCSLRLSGCKLRFGANAELPIRVFPGVGVVQQS